MLMFTTVENATSLVHKGETYKVVQGFADVPQAVCEEITSFPHWNVVVEDVDKKIITALKGKPPDSTKAE